ncbi:MAG: O-antigen ligase family protein [Clostridia bacterium]|jgi:hypothetical protein
MKKVIALFIILTVAAGPLFRGLFFPYEMYLSLAMLSVLCACYGIMKLVRKEEWHLRSVVVYGGIGLLLAYVIAFGTAVNMRGNIEALMQYAVYLLLFIVLSDFFHEHIQNLPWMYFVPLIAIGFFAAIIGLVGYTRVFPELDVTVNGRRIGSTLQYANTAAIYFLLLMSFVMGILLNVRNVLLKGILAGVANVMFMALFFTSSRGVFLVVPFAVLLALVIVMPKGYRLQSLVYVLCAVLPSLLSMEGYDANSQIKNIVSASKWILLSGGVAGISAMLAALLFRIKVNKIIRYAALGLCVIGTAAFVFVNRQAIVSYVADVIPDHIFKRIRDINFTTTNVVMRIEFFQDALRLLKDHWLFGLGGGGFASLYQSVQKLYYAARLVHNHYLQVFVESGILGILSFLTITISAFVYLIAARIRLKDPKQKVYAASVFVAFLSLAAHSAIDFNLSYTSMSFIFFSMVAVSAAYYRHVKKEKEASEETKQNPETKTFSWRRALVPSFFLLFCIPLAFFGIRYSKAAWYAERGTEYKQELNLEKAVENYAKASGLDPLQAANRAEMADLSLWMSKTVSTEAEKREWINKALSEGEEALRLDRYYPYYNRIMTEIYLFDGQYEKAAEQAKMLVYVQPLVDKNYELLAQAYTEGALVLLKEGNTDKAKEWLLACEDLEDNENVTIKSATAFYMGKAALLFGKYEKATELLQTARKGSTDLRIESDRLLYIINEVTGNEDLNKKYENVFYMGMIQSTPMYKEIKDILESGLLQ